MPERKFFFFLLLTCIIGVQLKAQSPENRTDSVFNRNMDVFQLPPLSQFMESIYTHPSLLIYESYRQEEQELLKVEKRKWMNYLKGVGIYQYGHNNAYIEGVNIGGPNSYYSGEVRSYYNIGVSLSVPLGDLVSNGPRIKAQHSKLKRVGYEYQIALENRKLMVLEAYNNIIRLLAILKSKADAATLYNAQMKMSEQDYINGKITIVDLSLERARRSTAVVSYEDAKAELQNAISLLEVLTNIVIIK